MFNIDIYPTHISISNAKEAVIKLEKLIELFEYEDEYEEVMKTLGYAVNDQTDTLYFNKGVDIDYIRKCLGEVNITIHSAPEPAEMS